TPVASDDANRKIPEPSSVIVTRNGTLRYQNHQGKQSFLRLSQVVKLLPTPLATADRRSVNYHNRKKSDKKTLTLSALAKMPHLLQSMITSVSYEDLQVALETKVSGQLNPMWTEWLMGFPIGWTE